jgi:hypothetical protein
MRAARAWSVAALATALATLERLAAGASVCSTHSFAPSVFGGLRENWGGECSGTGQCDVSNAPRVCTCAAGWNGYVDFFDLDGLDCPSNAAALRALWAVNTVIALVMMAKSAPKVMLRWRLHRELVQSKAHEGKKHTIWQNRGLLACLSSLFLCSPSVVVYGLIMQGAPDSRLGRDLGVTLVYAWAKLSFYLSVWLFQPALLHSVLTGKRATASLVKANDVGSLVLCICAGSIGLVPLICYGLSDGRDTTALVCYLITVGGTWIVIALLLCQAIYVKSAIVKVLDQSLSLTKSARTQAIKEALVSVQRENIFQCVYQLIVYSLFLALPWFYSKHAYFFPISAIAYVVLGKKVAFTTIDVERSTDSKTGTSHGSKGDEDGGSKSTREEPGSSLSSKAAAGSFQGPSFHDVPRGTKNAKVQAAISSYHDADNTSLGDEDDYV